MAVTRQHIFKSSIELDIPNIDLLSWTFDNPSYDTNKPIFVDADCPERSVSYDLARSMVRRLIAGFKAIGVQPGDTVCFHCENNIHYASIYLAVVGVGARFFGSNPNYTTLELIHLFTTTETKWVIAEQDHLDNVREAWNNLGSGLANVLVFEEFSALNDPEIRSWGILLAHGEDDWITFNDEFTSKTTIACLMSTSGTTGLPKAAQQSHYAQVASSILAQEPHKSFEVSRLLCLPQFHAFSAPLSSTLPLREGTTLYIMRKYDTHAYLNALTLYKPTETTMVNPIIYKLLQLGKKNEDALSSLRRITTGGVRLPSRVRDQFQQLLHPDATLRQVYGMTEVSWAISLLYPEFDDTGAAGRLLPNVEARMIGEDGEDVISDNVQGEILLRSPAIMSGYLNNSQTTNSTIVDGWLHTGDIAYVEEGRWFLIDRKKEIIKVRGWQVSPTEIEQCLLTHPSIVDAAVIGVDFEDQRGELPRAFVVVDPDHDLTDQDIHDYLKDRLVYYKWLSGGIRRSNLLPRGSTGKVLKTALRKESIEELLEDKKTAKIVVRKAVLTTHSQGQDVDEINLNLQKVMVGSDEIKGTTRGFCQRT